MAPTVLQLGRRFFTYVVGIVIALDALLDAVVAATDRRFLEVLIRVLGASFLFFAAIVLERVKIGGDP
ncbi:MAG TPA: hypothetical protein VGB18_01835 [Candidatus Thermoplasmatota archaeon]